MIRNNIILHLFLLLIISSCTVSKIKHNTEFTNEQSILIEGICKKMVQCKSFSYIDFTDRVSKNICEDSVKRSALLLRKSIAIVEYENQRNRVWIYLKSSRKLLDKFWEEEVLIYNYKSDVIKNSLFNEGCIEILDQKQLLEKLLYVRFKVKLKIHR